MPNNIVSEVVDIYKMPQPDDSHRKNVGTQITIGDLHGNAMKLLFMLVKHSIVTNIDKEDYNRLVEIYRTPITSEKRYHREAKEALTKEHIVEFNKILSKIKYNTDCMVRLIGDEIADRGYSDYYTLKILEKLIEHKVPVEILVSNHGIEFIEAYETRQSFSPTMLSFAQARSMARLEEFLEEGKFVTREEILEIVNKCYKPNLRIISYLLSDDQKEITIYSHAAIGLVNILNLGKKLNVEYKDATSIELANTIDKINMQFQEHVHNNTVHTLYKYYDLRDFCNANDAPFAYIIWNRDFRNVFRPYNYSGYIIEYVHGHDPDDYNICNIYNLDNELGKMEYYCDERNQGIYTVLYSWDGKMVPVIKPTEIEEEADVKQPIENEIKPAVHSIPGTMFHVGKATETDKIEGTQCNP